MRAGDGSGVLLMAGEAKSGPAVVRVFAPPVSECAGDNTWEQAARGIEARMRRRFGEAAVKLEFIHLFSREFFDHPEIMKLVQEGTGKPAIVTVNGAVVQTEGKLRERVVREELERIGLSPVGQPEDGGP